MKTVTLTINNKNVEFEVVSSTFLYRKLHKNDHAELPEYITLTDLLKLNIECEITYEFVSMKNPYNKKLTDVYKYLHETVTLRSDGTNYITSQEFIDNHTVNCIGEN